jgi:recombination protein RecA
MPAPKRRRVVKNGGGAAEAAPSSSGGMKKRTSIPVEPDIPDFPGELGAAVTKITQSGEYGAPFIKGSSKRLDTGRSSTGILSLDLALGGGWTKSRAGMLVGEKSSGKSTSALQSIATLHRLNPDVYAAWVDVEGTLDKQWAHKLGVDLERLIVVEPETGEHAVDLADEMALQARLVGKYIRRTNNALIKERSRNHKPILLHINQFRMKVGLVFGDPRTLPGGKALEFSTTQQVEIKNKEIQGKDEDGNTVVQYNEHNVKITKNKGGGPMKEAAFKLIRTEGQDDLPEAWVDQAKTIVNYGLQAGAITGSKNSFEIEMIGKKFRGAPDLNRWALENVAEYYLLIGAIVDTFRKKWNL